MPSFSSYRSCLVRASLRLTQGFCDRQFQMIFLVNSILFNRVPMYYSRFSCLWSDYFSSVVKVTIATDIHLFLLGHLNAILVASLSKLLASALPPDTLSCRLLNTT
ncbi:unnamed protein product [Calicophoron daubneyi]|uniref:Uncharacterized protein n=1 Tax=Calicophoron daubneyi TaxID=300641 RepID=A0AAV2TG11_CALDB